MDYSDLDLVLAGHKDGVNMIEVGAAEVVEADMVAAIEFGQEYIGQILQLIGDLASRGGRGHEKKTGDLVLPTPRMSSPR
jgi:polyribonucleotide nucleotidyltransferase